MNSLHDFFDAVFSSPVVLGVAGIFAMITKRMIQTELKMIESIQKSMIETQKIMQQKIESHAQSDVDHHQRMGDAIVKVREDVAEIKGELKARH